MSYLDYEYKDGDVVYCDIPYENTEKYDNEFNHQQFYDWAKIQDYPVYFSSYEGIEGFNIVWEEKKRVILSATNNSLKKVECLYCNKVVDKTYRLAEQLSLLEV